MLIPATNTARTLHLPIEVEFEVEPDEENCTFHADLVACLKLYTEAFGRIRLQEVDQEPLSDFMPAYIHSSRQKTFSVPTVIVDNDGVELTLCCTLNLDQKLTQEVIVALAGELYIALVGHYRNEVVTLPRGQYLTKIVRGKQAVLSILRATNQYQRLVDTLVWGRGFCVYATEDNTCIVAHPTDDWYFVAGEFTDAEELDEVMSKYGLRIKRTIGTTELRLVITGITL